MRRVSALFCASIMSLMQGCAIHPLQQDVTHLKTDQLVDHIRCEARAAMESKVITLLEEYAKGAPTPTLATQAAQLASDLKNKPELFRYDLRKKLQGSDEIDFYNRYDHMAIAFNFTFDISESDTGSAQIDLLKPFTGGALSLGISGNASLSRQNTRSFAITQEFGKLLTDTKLMCQEDIGNENLIYPISGTIGIKELIDTFIDLNEDYMLKADEKSPVFADTLNFVTTFGVGVNPKVTFVAAGRGLQVADAPLTSGATRVDKHQVIIGLALPVATDKKGQSKPRPIVRSFVIGTGVAASAATSAEQRALDATTEQRFNIFLNNFNTIVIN